MQLNSVGSGSFSSQTYDKLYFGANYAQVFLGTSSEWVDYSPADWPAGMIELIGGNLAAAYSLAWPGSPIAQPLDSRGFDRSIEVPNPNSNTLVWPFPWSSPGGGNVRYRVKSVQFNYTSSATAGSRAVQVFFEAKGGGIRHHEYQVVAPVVQIA